MVLRVTRAIQATLARGPALGLPVEAEAEVGDH
jgi:glutamate-1-semialdehyde aminotransferase